jgi:hypothetical protein
MVVAGAYRISARAATGAELLHRFRAGEAWPRGAGNFREVLVVDDGDDPPGRKLEDGSFAIGQKTFGTLQADPDLFFESELVVE